MSALHPGDPQLVSMIVSHLKTEGLFDQFRRDCLADVDTKPAYLHLRQRVDNFVSNHLANHTWSPQLNKNQLRNSIRQLVLQYVSCPSVCLSVCVCVLSFTVCVCGVAQVVDPKVHHSFRPQVERVVRRFLSPNSHVEEDELPPVAPPLPVENQEVELLTADIGNDPAPAGRSGADDVQILETSGTDPSLEHRDEEMDISLPEETEEEPQPGKQEEEETEEVKDEGDAGNSSKSSGKIREENRTDTDSQKPSSVKQKTRERLREEYSLEDSDLDGLSDITVSSVHTSDLSSFEGDSDEDEPLSDSTEEGEISSGAEGGRETPASEDSEDSREKKPRGVRQGYVHKPFLYSRYYSDSDDEVTVEQRRRSVAKDKEERLLKRQQNRERMEEKRRLRAAQNEEQDQKKLASLSADQRPRAKEARKEKKVLEKKVALSRQRKRDSRKEDETKKSDTEGDSVNKDVNPVGLKRRPSDLEEQQRRRKTDSEEKLPDKNRIHSFILDLELGTEESRKTVRKDSLSKEKECKEKEKERGVPDERLKHKLKTESRKSRDAAADEKDGGTAKAAADEKKGSKVKQDRKSSVSS
ncbi:biorientation of chromosomes in cell division protein 1-like 1 [Carassius carassius]|uniref:biorientation of chromosomes in cell division protein 1-like 1 n=1 Tax=Carassius carassius TaxID=217509 RepID=UPI0028686DD4|nr:biorientation of chromosomes in cell division protein 1-like 1 [Carassius carassius]